MPLTLRTHGDHTGQFLASDHLQIQAFDGVFSDPENPLKVNKLNWEKTIGSRMLRVSWCRKPYVELLESWEFAPKSTLVSNKSDMEVDQVLPCLEF